MRWKVATTPVRSATAFSPRAMTGTTSRPWRGMPLPVTSMGRTHQVSFDSISSRTRSAFWVSQSPVPPLPEQTAIARFLDLATSRIDRYIRAKK